MNLREDGSFSCGGSILTEIKILTAAHCFKLRPDMSGYTILAGSSYIFGGENGQERRVSRGVHYPRDAEGFSQGDIGILFLADPLIFGQNVRAIQLPPQNASVPYGASVPMAGWGITDNDDITALPNVLHHINVTIFSNEECNRPSSYNGSIQAFEVCAGAMEGGLGACKGDSGSPLVVGRAQYGILSWGGFGCATPNYPGVFVRVPFFVNWIHSIQ